MAALDLDPPDWRGHERSTYQFWDFSTADLAPLPEDGYENPFGPLPADVQPASGIWYSEKDGHFGVFPLSGNIYVPIYNFPEPWDQKIIQVQLTWLSKTDGVPQIEAMGDDGVWMDGVHIAEKDVVLDQGWMHSTYLVILQPNPTQETVHIFGDIYIDDLVIDTLCIPEPATLALMIFGAIMLVAEQKKVFPGH